MIDDFDAKIIGIMASNSFEIARLEKDYGTCSGGRDTLQLNVNGLARENEELRAHIKYLEDT